MGSLPSTIQGYISTSADTISSALSTLSADVATVDGVADSVQSTLTIHSKALTNYVTDFDIFKERGILGF